MNSEEWAKKFDELKGSEDQKAPEFHWVESVEIASIPIDPAALDVYRNTGLSITESARLVGKFGSIAVKTTVQKLENYGWHPSTAISDLEQNHNGPL